MTAHWLVIAPRNAPAGSGKWVFLPEAKRFAAFVTQHDGVAALVTFDVTDSKIARRLDVLGQAEKFGAAHYQHAAVFSHGWESGLQCGLLASDWPELLGNGGTHRITLYACSTGEGPGVGGEGGYADRVREALARADLSGTVLAHRTAGHATLNPTLALFSSYTVSDGGVPLVPDYRDPAWFKRRKWPLPPIGWLTEGVHRFELAVDPDPRRWGYEG